MQDFRKLHLSVLLRSTSKFEILNAKENDVAFTMESGFFFYDQDSSLVIIIVKE